MTENKEIQKPLPCTSYCTARSYMISALSNTLKSKGSVDIQRNVIHFQPEGEKDKDAFFFAYGVTIFWGFEPGEEKEILHLIKGFEKGRFPHSEYDEFCFEYGKAMNIYEDLISLPDREVFTKLAISYALAQSAKLTIFEQRILKTVEQSQQIPLELSTRGKISLSRRQTAKKMGEIFIERNFINLQGEILDVPEFFWDYPALEDLYSKVLHYLDVSLRIDLLNKRFNILHDLYEILSNQLNHQHESRLEWIIIVLILIEVSVALLTDLFHVF